jgi:hypothetical protein
MFAVRSQRRVRQKTEEERSALQTKIMDRTVIEERNVVRSDIMVPPLDSIYETIQTYHLGYLYTCACIVLTRLVRLFYANLEVAQDDDRGMVLQSTVDGHIITVDPQIISHFIGLPILDLVGSPYNEVVLLPSMDDLREFFYAVPQGDERATQDQHTVSRSSFTGQDSVAQPMASCQVQWPDSEEGSVRLCHPPPLAFLPVQAYYERHAGGPWWG